MNELILEQKIDPDFKNFFKFIKNKDIKLAIVSDGFDFYINKILKKYDICDIECYCNKMEYHPDGLKIKFTYQNPRCDICGCCKSMVVNKYLSKNKKVVFIGDSYGDSYAVRISDVVFAKDKLSKFCKKNDITHVEYNNFADILSHLKKMDFSDRFEFINNRKCIMIDE